MKVEKTSQLKLSWIKHIWYERYIRNIWNMYMNVTYWYVMSIYNLEKCFGRNKASGNVLATEYLKIDEAEKQTLCISKINVAILIQLWQELSHFGQGAFFRWDPVWQRLQTGSISNNHILKGQTCFRLATFGLRSMFLHQLWRKAINLNIGLGLQEINCNDTSE